MSHTGTMPAPLQITVTNANLKFVRHPMMVGHYRSLALTGTELAMDVLIGGTMSTALRMGLYPDEPGSQQVFINTHANHDNPMQPPRPGAVIVVGLGEEGKLRAPMLAQTVRQGVMTWAQRIIGGDMPTVPAFELAASLIGSSGTGNPAGQAARLVAQGVREANIRLTEVGWPTVSHLHLVELFLDRATEAWRSLQILAIASPGEYVITPFVQAGLGALQRPLDPSYRGSEYDLISAMTQQDGLGDTLIAYTVDTRRARTEVRAQATQIKLLRELTTSAADDETTDKQIGRSLFRLLVPLEMQPFLGGSDAMLLELDSGTAGIPWELLDASTSDELALATKPWAIRTKLLRKLRTVDFRAVVQDADADAHVLVIGEPRCDDPSLPRLPAARAEALDVAALFAMQVGKQSGTVKQLICGNGPSDVGPDARTIVNSLLERDWRIIHIAGHGEPPDVADTAADHDSPDAGGLHAPLDPRGVVLSGGTYLGPREVATMPVVPELVFVNCCFTGVGDSAQVLEHSPRVRPDHARFAAGIAEELIRIGVRCVIAAGWAVEDHAALVFAHTFYDALLGGNRFIDAVAAARTAAWQLGGNTWAAYQCYGDPDWRFVAPSPDAQQAQRSSEDKYAGVASWRVLLLALEAISVESRYPGYDKARGREHVNYLESRFQNVWGTIGTVAEAFAMAWVQLDERERAIAWYRRAIANNDGTASLRSVMELGNQRVRVALEKAERARAAALAAGGDPTVTMTTIAAALATGRDEINSALSMLEQVADLQPTIERDGKCGSAWKRLSILEAMAGDGDAETTAISRMKRRYDNAETLARSTNHPELYYPALNRMAAELIVDAGDPSWTGFDAGAVAEVRDSLAAKTRDDPDFWSVVGVTELRLYEALAHGALAPELESVMAEYAALYERVSATSMWSSVYDQVRWVIPKYKRRVNAAEGDAAQSLLDRLAVLANA
jgi:CHAT domain-containing protein